MFLSYILFEIRRLTGWTRPPACI